jgi:dihydropteroate synthase
MDLIRSTIDLENRVQVMGVLNLTPDSFSDGGLFQETARGIERAREMEAEGADLLDIGGESTRPGSRPVTTQEELDRILPVLEGLHGKMRIPISVDTTKSEVAAAAIRAGAEILNDISGLRFDPALANVAAETGAGLILMHSRGTPETMQSLPPVQDIFQTVCADLETSLAEAAARGVRREKIILDPGIGFGKTVTQNLELIAGLDRLIAAFGLPVLLGTSRKSFIPRTLDRALKTARRNDAMERRAGTAASIALGIARGARLVRVHDVAEMAAVTRLTEEILRHGTGSEPPLSDTIA